MFHENVSWCVSVSFAALVGRQAIFCSIAGTCVIEFNHKDPADHLPISRARDSYRVETDEKPYMLTHCQSKPFQFQEQRAPALLNRGGGGVPQFLDIWKTKWQKFTLIQPRIRLQHQNHLVSSLCPYTGGYKLVSPAFFRPENHLNLLLDINKWSLISINRFRLHTAAFPSGHSAIPVKLGIAA